MRNIRKEIERVQHLFETDCSQDLTVNEANYIKDNYSDLFDLIYVSFMFGFSQGMKGVNEYGKE